MELLRIAIVFNHSLFAAGIASRLREAGFTDVCLVDTQQINAMHKVIELNPNVVVYDSADAAMTKDLWVFAFLKNIPGVRLMQVDYAREEVQVYCSQQMPAHEMTEFISMMKNIAITAD
jgi:DNA-binding NarL/FixJ family response regulator